MKIKDIIAYLETFAPLAYQENYDNAGLIVGDSTNEVNGILICLDSTEEVIEEAIQKKCNLVIAHHPIIFKGLKKINGKNYIERTIIKAIKNDIAIYASHTNLDHAFGGVNFKITEKLELLNPTILSPKAETMLKLVVFVPIDFSDALLDALHQAGAGNIGNYSHVSFKSEGEGAFKPNELANPSIGTANQHEKVLENRLEVIVPIHLKNQVLAAMYRVHPYEEIAFDLIALENLNNRIGAGLIAELANEIDAKEFLGYLKQKLDLNVIRHTELIKSKIKRVALCGGAGSFLLSEAIRQQADVFITADYKYHEFFDADKQIIIADIGHFESEQFTKELLKDIICKKFTNFAVNLSETPTNPIHYYY